MSTLLLSTVVAASVSPPTEDLSRLLVWVAVPAAILGAGVAALIKHAVLSSNRFRTHRPGVRTFIWIAIADLIVWAVLWPALLVVRIQEPSAPRALWVLGLLLVIALGYFANRYGFGRAFDPKIAGSMRGTMLAELFTILMPVFAVLFAFVIFWVLAAMGV